MMRYVGIFLFLICSFNLWSGRGGHVLEGIYNPVQLVVKGKRIYVADQGQIHIFDLKNFDRIRELGGKGEGPGEFKTQPLVRVKDKRIFLFSFLKIARFSYQGKLLEEHKWQSFSQLFNFDEVGDNFIVDYSVVSGVGDSIRQISVFDKTLQEKKKLLTINPEKKGKTEVCLLNPTVEYGTIGDRIYLLDSRDGFNITVFNSDGNLLFKIDHDFKKIKVPQDYKQNRQKEFLQKFALPVRKEVTKRIAFKFPEYFPVVQSLYFDKGNIFVKTYERVNLTEKYIILGPKGNIRGNLNLPVAPRKCYSFHNDTFFYLYENENGEIEFFFQALSQ